MSSVQPVFTLRSAPPKSKGKWSLVAPDADLLVHPAKSGDHWFEYNTNWMTVAVFDDKGKELAAGASDSVSISMKFVAESGTEVLPVETTTKASKGVFWFRSIDPFLFGHLTLTFSSGLCRGHPVEPLVVQVSASKDIYGKAYAESELVVRDEMGSPQPGAGAAAAPSLAAAVAVGGGGGGGGGGGRKRADSHGSGPAAAAAAAAGAGGGRVKRARKVPVFTSTSDDILHVPTLQPLLSARHRIERFVKETPELAAPSSAGTKRGGWRIDGPVLKVELSPSLTAAVLDDKTQVEAYVSLERAGYDIQTLEQARSNAHRPTVNELFLKLQNKMAQIPEIGKLIAHLRMCFECMFENNILFVEEKELFKHKIDTIRNSHSKFGDSFGCIHFLRFIIFFVMAADSASFDDAAASSSAQRRNTISSRNGKTTFLRLQEVIDAALRDLDEGAHYYYC